MRRPLFLLTLVLYAWSAMEMHEWARVPQVVLHLLEHHSDFGHHDEEGEGHQHEGLPADEHDHSPFDEGCSDEFCACSGVAFVPYHHRIHLTFMTDAPLELGVQEAGAYASSYCGSKWNPPKLA